jgi:hypothetical protein
MWPQSQPAQWEHSFGHTRRTMKERHFDCPVILGERYFLPLRAHEADQPT